MASIKRNFLYNLFLQMSKVLFPLITAPYVARVLDPDGVGIFNFVNTYSYYFALFAVLGIPTYGIREVAKRRDDLKACETFVSQMISIELVSTLFVSLIYVASVLLIGQLNEHALLFLIAGVTLYICPFKIEWFFSGREEFGFITFRSLVIKTISVVLLFFVVKDKGDLVNYVILNMFAMVSNEVWNYVKLYRLGIRPRFTLRGTREHVKPVLILFASSIAISIYVMLDTLMLGFLSSYEEVGYYNSAMHVVKGMLPIVTALATVALPKVSHFMKENDIGRINDLTTKSLGIVSFTALPLMVGIIMIAPVFVPLFFGNQFCNATQPMQIGAILLVIIGLNNLEGTQILIGIGNDKDFLLSVSLGAIVNFLLNLVLIPYLGATGAALASVMAELTIVIVMGVFIYKHTTVRFLSFSEMYKALCASLLFIPICLLCENFSFGWMYIISCFLLCTLSYVISQYFLKSQMLHILQETLKRMLLKK